MRCAKKIVKRVVVGIALLLVSGLMQAQEPLRQEKADTLTLSSAQIRDIPDTLSLALPADKEVADSISSLHISEDEEFVADSLSEALPLFFDVHEDTLRVAPDSLQGQIVSGNDTLTIIDGKVVPAKEKGEVWTPDPARATWSAIAFPGGGQIYNRKYWKLPIVYGGFLGCVYALNWNNQMYSDYSQAYLDIMDDDDKTASYLDMLPPTYNVEANKDYLKNVFKHRKDRYRRYRDLSIFCFMGVYLISIIDAYVDAELSHFDISEDLGFHIQPSSIHSDFSNPYHTQGIGLQCSINF